MSYYATFKPTDEAVEKFKSWAETDKLKQWITDTKFKIMINCMKGNDGKDIQTTINEYRLELNYLAKSAEMFSRNATYEQYQEDKEVWFCGWEYSRPYDAPDMADTEEYVMKELLLETYVVKTADYDENGESFYSKVGRIMDLLDYFEETASKSADFQMMEELKEFRIPDGLDELKECVAKNKTEESDSCATNDEGSHDTEMDGECGSHSAVTASVTDGDNRADITFTPSPKQVPSWL